MASAAVFPAAFGASVTAVTSGASTAGPASLTTSDAGAELLFSVEASAASETAGAAVTAFAGVAATVGAVGRDSTLAVRLSVPLAAVRPEAASALMLAETCSRARRRRAERAIGTTTVT